MTLDIYNGSSSNPGNGDCTVEFLAINGGTETLLQSISGLVFDKVTPDNLSLSFSTGPSHPNLGERVAIRLKDTTTANNYRNRPFYDNVSLVANAVPEVIWNGSNNDWNSNNWTVGLPPQGEAMIVNGGTVSVRQDLPGANLDAVALTIARDNPNGTVEVVDGGHLLLTSGVAINSGGALNVTNGTLTAGPDVNVIDGTFTVGVRGTATATNQVTIDATSVLTVDGSLSVPTLSNQGTATIAGGTIGTIASAGDTTVTGGAVTTFNSSGTGEVSGGAVATVNADAGTFRVDTAGPVIGTLNGSGATISTLDAGLASNVVISGGSLNLGASTAVDTLEISGGTVDTQANELTVNAGGSARLDDLTIDAGATTGFVLSGADLGDHG